MKTFEQIKNILEEKGLLVSSTQKGASYDIAALRTKDHEEDLQHKLEVVRDTFWDNSISFMTGEKLFRSVFDKLIERYELNLPFQLLVVNDIDEAEVAVEEFLAE